jgi:uncharacterized integral membrane protein
MKTNAVIYIVAATAIGIFIAANWGLLAQPVELNFLLAHVQAPLALLLLLFGGLILLLDLSVHTVREYRWIRDRRALARELEHSRLRAERAEKDHELRSGASAATISSELGAIRAQLDRVLATQAIALHRTVRADRSEEAEQPELIPPRDSRGHGPH